MRARVVLERLERCGIKLKTDGSNLLVSPSGVLTPETRKFLIDHKAEVINLLQKPVVAGMDMLPSTPRTRLFSYLNTWTQMNAATWSEVNMRSLHDDILDVFKDHPQDADEWLREWRAQHPEARLT